MDENGVIRCKGRLMHASIQKSKINPIIIPNNSRFALLLVLRAHLQTKHGGKMDTLTHLRSKYWVLNSRKLIHSVVRGCVLCNRLESKPFRSVESPQLPEFRVQKSPPFLNVGCDYLGPLMVRDVFESNNDMHKVEVVLYTCAVTRAVHLDLVPDLSASAFLRSFKRFINRRGIPKLIISDNATCFKNDEVRFNEELLRLNVKWKFIVEASPKWGGF